MAKTKIREITLAENKGSFSIFKKSKVSEEEKYDFSSLFTLRQLLSNEKARILHVIKTQHPSSIYELAKKLGRGFKIVSEDVKLLGRLGFIQIVEEKVKNRIRHRPEIAVDTLTIHFKI